VGRDAVVVAVLGLSATVVTASGRLFHGPDHGPEVTTVPEVSTVNAVSPVVEVRVGPVGVLATVGGLDSSAVCTVSVVNERGDALIPSTTSGTGVRFDDLPIGTYRIIASSEGPMVHDGDAVISSAVVVRSEPFALLAPGPVVVESR
jgi:hypothetical protein